jgi:hypothetical protein
MRALRVRRSFGLRYRSPVRFVPCLHSHGASVHCVRPSRDVVPTADLLFFASPKKSRQKKGDPTVAVGLWPTALRCSVFGARAKLALFAALTPLRQTSRSQLLMRAIARGPKPLRSSTPPTGPKSNTGRCFATSHPHLASHRARGEADASSCRCEARRIWCSGPRGWRRGAQGFGAACAARFVI